MPRTRSATGRLGASSAGSAANSPRRSDDGDPGPSSPPDDAAAATAASGSSPRALAALASRNSASVGEGPLGGSGSGVGDRSAALRNVAPSRPPVAWSVDAPAPLEPLEPPAPLDGLLLVFPLVGFVVPSTLAVGVVAPDPVERSGLWPVNRRTSR